MILQICNRSSQSPTWPLTLVAQIIQVFPVKLKMTVNSYIYVKFCRPTEENKILIGFSSGFCSPAAFSCSQGVLSLSGLNLSKILGLTFLPEVAVSQSE